MSLERDQRADAPDRRKRALGGRRDGDKERQPKAECPFCGFWDSVVLHGHPEGDGYVRRRRCLSPSCQQRFNTLELAVRKYPYSTRRLRTSS